MRNIKQASINIPTLNEFNFELVFNQTDRENHTHQIDLHTHQEFEIYINLSGDVSFLVENRLYPLSRGDVIIARPGEQHHCVYRSDLKHSFFWILFDVEKNPSILDFFQKNVGINYISPKEDLKNELIDLCFNALENQQEFTDKLYFFFRLLQILEQGTKEVTNTAHAMPEEMVTILSYIDNHISENLQVSDIASALYISESTVRRRFREYIDIKPLEFIQKKKLHTAAELLKQGESVLNAGLNVGYTDNSYFIQLFKRQYGITPYQYKSKIKR